MPSERPIVEFFFSPGSRYSYLAASQDPRIQSDAGCQFDWRPVRGTEIRALRGRDPFRGEALSGQYEWDYRRRDAEMWAEHYGIAFREPPSHALDLDLLTRAAAAGALLGGAATYGWALCSAVYGSKIWPIDREACLGVAEQVGVARGPLGRLIDDPASGTLLSRAAQEAYERAHSECQPSSSRVGCTGETIVCFCSSMRSGRPGARRAIHDAHRHCL